jgi:hypothetical protein
VLMCNYLLALEDRAGATGPVSRDSGVGDGNWRSYLVMGLAIPDGEVTWILRRHRREDIAVLIDPMTVCVCVCVVRPPDPCVAVVMVSGFCVDVFAGTDVLRHAGRLVSPPQSVHGGGP